jgi:hypothetical protein
MGLGDPVDTVAPTAFIDSPEDNSKLKAITIGNPIVMEGSWMDDIGVTSMQFEIIDKWRGNAVVTPSRKDYTITTTGFSEGFASGKWRAEIVINSEVATEYRIRVYVLDRFGNKGMAEVNVRIDIIPPWVDNIKIQRHPNHPNFKNTFVQNSEDYSAADTGSSSGKRDSLPSYEYYTNKGFDFYKAEAWRDIKFENIDEFQNEFFRISTELIATFDNIAAARLNIYTVDGKLLNTEKIVPSGYTIADQPDKTHLRYPYWDITHAQLVSYDQENAGGPHYIYFEIRAWSDTDWTGTDLVGKPNIDLSTGAEEPGRSQLAGGTVWYPESDNPIAYIDKRKIIGTTNTITLTPNTTGALDIDIYDDDKLNNIFLGLVSKDDFDTRRMALNKTETEYLAYLTDDSNSTERTAIMNLCITQNLKSDLYTEVPDTANRNRTLPLATGGEGEFRLIALVRESARPESGYNYANNIQKWSAYPPLIVQVQSATAPLIIVENPLKDNAFPNLEDDGRTFIMSGYALAGLQVNKVLIAWVPPNRTASDADTAITASDSGVWAGNMYTHTSGVKVWNIPTTDQGQENFGSADYYKTGFTKTFDIADDFQYNGASAFKGITNNNLFVIRAYVTSNSATKNFRLIGTTAGPTIRVTSPTSPTSYHDIGKELVLRMQVEKTEGIALKDNSFVIEDTTSGIPSGLGPLTGGNGEYQRIAPLSSVEKYGKGDPRTYEFKAENILGNEAKQNRTIIMSIEPLIESILCANGSDTYGEGTELFFDVTYSMPVNVIGTPRLKLFFVNQNDTWNAASSPYAVYVGPQASETETASNTLQFRYVVKLNDNTALLQNTYTNPPIDLNGATIQSFSLTDALNKVDQAVSMQTKQTVKLDGVHPTVLRAYFTQNGLGTNPTYFTKSKTITINLTCSEPIMVAGSPIVYIATTAGTISTFPAVYSSKSSETLSFTYTVEDSVNITQERQLSWAASSNVWINMNGGSIKDNVGNDIDVSTAARPGQSNLQGTANGSYTNQEAYIKTNKPATPTLTIHSTQPGAQATNATTAVVTGNNLSGQYFYVRAAGIEITGTNNTVNTSFTGGSTPHYTLGGTGNYRYSTGTTNAITDAHYDSRNSSGYTPSTYTVAVWQTDRAGNESDRATRDVTINSRPADLTGIDINLQNGSHPAGTVVPFKLSFAQKITVNANATVKLDIKGIGTNATGTANIPAISVPVTNAGNPASSMITLNWTVPNTQATMKDIKVTNIQFTNMVDEYGNALTRYNGSALDNGLIRPIQDTKGTTIESSSFQLARPDLEIRSIGPKLVQVTTYAPINSTSPIMPTASGDTQNGGLIATDKLTLVFAEVFNSNTLPVNLTAIPGKYITIRPYGTWAIPPELTVEEFNSVYNHANVASNATYRRRLQDVDLNEMPNTGSGRGSGFNLYKKNTHGIITHTSGVRPDTGTKMILDFTTDLYEGTNATNLREVFNAAKWKQQEISVTSSAVSVSANVVTVTIPAGKLDKGRIWEVIIDEGAFQDPATNPSQAVETGTYRFWTDGTATPYVRADKVSYDNRNDIGVIGTDNVTLGFVSSAGVPVRPPVDMRVRIDCETPGANINYDVIRTSYTLNPGQGADSDAFTNTNNTNATFFRHNGIAEATDTGYANNTIGNELVTTAANKTNGFLNKLLVPNVVQTGTATLTNGTIPMSTLDTLGSGLTGTGTTGNVRQYQSFNNSDGVRTWGTTTFYTNFGTTQNPNNIPIIYVGELYSETSAPAILPTGNIDVRMYTGRRDYIVARAKKGAIEGNATNKGLSGPALAQSDLGMEGVYKTTLIYRDPYRNAIDGATATSGRLARLLVQGYDTPVMAVVAGFPLRDADTTNATTDAYSNYFSKSAWRYGTGNNYITWTATTLNNDPEGGAPGNNHIWVSWEIVTDWFQKGKGFRRISGNYLNNGDTNSDAVASTYGAVIYRYRQRFYN